MEAHRGHTGSKQVEVGMCGKDPKPIVFSPEGLDCGAFREVPDTHGLVLATRNDEFVFGVEERVGDVVEMTSAGVDLPGLCFAHPPNLDRTIVRSRDNQGEGGMEGGEIDASVVAFEDIFYGRKRVECFEIVRSSAGRALSQTGNVPDAYGLIHGCRHDEIVLWMELGRHDIV